MIRWVITGLDEFLHIVSAGANVAAPEISCDWSDLPRLRVALERTVDELDQFVASKPEDTLSKAVQDALVEYAKTRET